MIGRKIQHYQVTEKLGEGGMGVVYRADDTRLGRTVALKFLPVGVMGDVQERERLRNEARSAAAVNHPNICTIYEIGDLDDHTYIAMEYIEGATLRDRVLSGRIELTDALRYVIQIASGLGALHEAGIIHRDMKSANIMINRAGQAVIMDFGLARRTGQQPGERRLSSRGTSAYMSPEQARGEAVDERTDIWSLGVILYEMITGHLPFRGDYEQAVMYSILNELPHPISEFRTGVPASIQAVVVRCLEKDPTKRYATLEAFVVAVRGALDKVTGTRRVGAVTPRRRSLTIPAAAVVIFAVVLGFFYAQDVKDVGSQVRIPIAVADFDNETGQATLDGLSGMLITALEQSDRLSVMTRGRMFDVARSIGADNIERVDESVGQRVCIAAGVRALAIPTIRRFGDLYTIELKVLDTQVNRYIFSAREEGAGQESIPRLIDRMARDIRVDLAGTALDPNMTPVAEVTTQNLEAYAAYFRGESHLHRLEFEDAKAAFQEAVAADSLFALAHYRLGYLTWWSQQALEEARVHVETALEHAARMPEKERYLARALRVAIVESFDAQIPILREMEQRFPDDKEMLFSLGDALFHAGDTDTARIYFEAVLTQDPTFERALQHLTWAYLNLGEFELALETGRKWVEVHGSAEAFQNLAQTQFRMGDSDGALATAQRVMEMDPDVKEPRPWVAELYISRGEVEKGVAFLEGGLNSEDRLRRLGAGGMLARSVYPYLGRYRDAMATYDHGIDYLENSGTAIDSTLAVVSKLGRALTRFHAWHDADALRAEADKVRSVPEQHRKYGYWELMANIAALTGDSAAAREIMREHDLVQSSSARALYETMIYATSHACDAAVRTLESYSNLFEKRHPGYRNAAEFTVGWCLFEAERYKDAAVHLERVVAEPLITFDVMPILAPAYYMLGRSYEAESRWADARRCYRRVLVMWEDADKDLPVLRETREGLARLDAVGSM